MHPLKTLGRGSSAVQKGAGKGEKGHGHDGPRQILFDRQSPGYSFGEDHNGRSQKKIGFDGLVISDAMEMSAVSNNFSVEEIVSLFLNAEET